MKTDRIIALDIGTDGIRMAVAVSGSSTLLDSGFAEYASDVPAELPREAVVAMTLKRLLEGRKPGTHRARISIEGQSVFSRLVKLPRVGKDQLEKTIRHEAVQNIPFPIDEVVWDSHVIDPESPEPEVLLVAVKTDLVEGLVHAVRANGLTIEQISVAPVALANAVQSANASDGPILLVDAGDQVANLVFLDGNHIFFRTLPVAGHDTERLIQEIERSITFYRSQQGGRMPVRILAGSAVSAPAAGRLSIPVEEVQRSAVSVCTGLAVEQAILINLTPESLLKERELKQKQPIWLASAIVLLILVGVWIANVNLLARQDLAELGRVEKKIGGLSRVEKQMLPLEGRIKALTGRAEVYQTAVEKQTHWMDTLLEINRLLPEGMFLHTSEPIRPMGQLSGTRISVISYLDKETEGEDAVKQLRDTLRSSPLFSEKTKVFSRPSKKQFAREFILDVYFAEEES